MDFDSLSSRNAGNILASPSGAKGAKEKRRWDCFVLSVIAPKACISLACHWKRHDRATILAEVQLVTLGSGVMPEDAFDFGREKQFADILGGCFHCVLPRKV